MAETDSGESYFSKLRGAVPEEVSGRVQDLGRRLEESLLAYMLRPGSDPEVLELTRAVIGKLDHTLHFGQSGEPLSAQKLDDVKAGLIGAARVLDPAMEKGYSPIAPLQHVRLASRFLELAEKRVGKVDKTTGEVEVRQRLSDRSAAPTVKYTPKK